jgi:hypothetical protein
MRPKLDPSNRAIDDLRSAVAILQKSVSQLQAAEKERKIGTQCSGSQNPGHFPRARPFSTVEGEQQANAKHDEEIERRGHNYPSFPDHPVRMIYPLRQGP